LKENNTMAKFQITINLENDAFKENEKAEIVRILKDDVIDLLEKGEMIQRVYLFDVNGNKVGSAKKTK
jgi:hypothetical protein